MGNAKWFSMTVGSPYLVITLSKKLVNANTFAKSYMLGPFQFQVVNGVLAQLPPSIFVSATMPRVDGEQTVLPLRNMTTPEIPLAPLFLQKVFVLANVGQSDGSPALQNVITVTLQTNFLLPAGSQLTFGVGTDQRNDGFVGAVYPKGPIAIQDGGAGAGAGSSYFSSAVCEEQENATFYGKGYWCPGLSQTCPCNKYATKHLVVKTAQPIAPCTRDDSLLACMLENSSYVVFSFQV